MIKNSGGTFIRSLTKDMNICLVLSISCTLIKYFAPAVNLMLLLVSWLCDFIKDMI